MKKAIIFLSLVILAFTIITNTINAQTKTDYFVGKWDILVTGTPNGDAKMKISLDRKNGKLEGMVKLGDQAQETNLFDIEDKGTIITFNISAGDYVVRFYLERKDDNHVIGTMMDQFDVKGERILNEGPGIANVQTNPDFFPGQWNLLVAGTPNGDVKMIVSLARKDGKLDGTIKIGAEGYSEPLKLTRTEEKGASLTIYFTAEGHDLSIFLEKKDENHLAGNQMDMFDVKGERILK
jgi:hypothetical protein